MTVNNNVGNVVDLRGIQYADNAMSKMSGVAQEKILAPMFDHFSENGAKYLGVALLAFLSYASFRWLASQGETQPMPVREYKLLTLKYEDGTKTMEVRGEKTLEGPELEGLIHFEVRNVGALENHVNNIEQLITREEVVAWLITYQHLTSDGNGRDVVRGTVGAGLATMLRGIMAGENIRILDVSTTEAIVDTLKELRKNGELPILNSTDRADSLKFQQIEAAHHRLGGTASTLSPESRSNIAWLASGVQGLPKATLGLSRVLSKVLPEL
jgi:hypothetical protein